MRDDRERLADLREAIERIEKYAVRGRDALAHDEWIQTWTAMTSKNIIYRVHAVQRMFERSIDETDVKAVLEQGEVIEDYPNDKPYPSQLILGWRGTCPLHVVAAR